MGLNKLGQDVLLAVNELIDWYEFKTAEKGECPLCQRLTYHCYLCPYVLIEKTPNTGGIPCYCNFTNWFGRKNKHEFLAAITDRVPEWCEFRLEQLYRWKKVINSPECPAEYRE